MEYWQGTYVEGVKEEVVLSPAHALSLIAAGEGNQNFRGSSLVSYMEVTWLHTYYIFSSRTYMCLAIELVVFT